MGKKKSLKETNPYLRDPELREALIELSVASSTAVEGVCTKYPKLARAVENKLKEVISVQQSAASSE